MIVYEFPLNIVIVISSLFIVLLFLCNTYRQKLERDGIAKKWKYSKWEYIDNKRVKYPLWSWIFLLVTCMMPILNIILVISMLITYLCQLIKPDGMDGINLVTTRIVIKCKWFNWLKFLNKKI